MLGELTAEQIVDAANAIYQGATAAGYSPAQALEKVQSEAAAYGLSPAEVDAAFRTAYGGAAYAPAQEIVAEVIRTASGYPDIRLEASADETLVRQAAYIYSIQGPAGVVAALLKNGITIDQLAMAVSRTSYIIAQGDASAIINTYWAIADQSRRISDAINVQSVTGDFDRRLWTVQTHTQGAFNIPMDGVSMPPPPPPPASSGGYVPPPESQRMPPPPVVGPPSPSQVLVAQAISLYSSGGAPAVVAAMLANGVTVESLTAAFAEAGVNPNAAAASDVLSTYRAIEQQSVAISALPIQRVTMDLAARQWVVEVSPGVVQRVPMDGRSLPTMPGAGPTRAVIPPDTGLPVASPPPQVQPPTRTTAPPVPRTLTAAQIVQATADVFRTQPDPRSGLNAVRGQAAAAGYTWDQVVDAYRTVGGSAWTTFQATLAAAGEAPAPETAGIPGWLIPAALAALSFLK